MPSPHVIHVLTGCTAVGKTEAALRWAQAHGAEIVSCDSLLFYRGMDIGTAKPTKPELAQVRHHLIDICDPEERMDIARYVGLARAAVNDIAHRGKPILVTGGSGFYLKAFFGPVVDAVVIPAAVRARVAGYTVEQAWRELEQLNPAGLANLDTANPRRVVRALERCLATGKTVRELQQDFAKQPPPFADFAIKTTELVRSSDDLAQRITRRVDLMLAAGLQDEVRQLLSRGLRENPSAAAAIGYREVIARFEGRLEAARLREEIIRNTRALVKKQRTWFRTQLPTHRVLSANEGVADALFEP